MDCQFWDFKWGESKDVGADDLLWKRLVALSLAIDSALRCEHSDG